MPMLPPRALFGRPRRDNVLNQTRPRPSEVETAAQAPQPSSDFAEAFRPYALSTQTPGIGDGVQERREAMNAEANGGVLEARQQVAEQPALRSAIGQGPLGHSMRQPFDYDKAMEVLAGNQKKPKDWQIAVAILGDAMASVGGHQPYAVQSLVGRRNAQQERLQEAAAQLMKWRYSDYSRQNEADLQAANPFTIGRDRVMYDPASGQAKTIYDGAEDFELYAEELGLEPGTEEYFAAVEDFVLRSAGPSAHSRDLEMDDHRTGNDERLEGVRHENRASMESLRQRNRVGMEGVRQGNRLEVRATPPARAAGTSAAPVKVKTPAEAQKLKAGTLYQTPDGQVLRR
jgi:hypothetical protein